MLPRFRNLRPVMDPDIHEEIVHRIQEGSPKMPWKLSHPDVAPANMLRVNGAVLLIDNELMCCTKHYMIDIFNMLRNFPKIYRFEICRDFWKDSQLADDLGSNNDYYQALWLAREAGSDLISNRLDGALRLIDHYVRGENILPIDM